MYADLQCHPGAAAYDRIYPGDPADAHPWRIPQSNLTRQSKGKKAVDYSQGDLAKSISGEAKLLFTALYPAEKGFFAGTQGGRLGKKVIAEFFRRLETDGQSPALQWLVATIRTQPGFEYLEASSLDFLQGRLLNFPLDRVRQIQYGEYDYFTELKREYQFYRSKSDKPGSTTDELQLCEDGLKKKWCGTYSLARDGNDVRERFSPACGEIMMVLTIEGIHALGVGNPEEQSLRGGEPHIDATVGKLKSRIRQLKGEEPLEDSELKKWEHRPFFITFAHHFNNSLCGHARSLPALSSLIFDQRKNLDKGMLRQGAYEVIHELLGLDEDLNPTGSKRILIDINHMSAASRSDFYKNVLRPFNYKAGNKNRKIPLIASHTGYSGIDRLEVQIRNAHQDKEVDNFRINKFLAWGINLTDEDIIEIHQSNGLIGISFDQRILGRGPTPWFAHLGLKALDRRLAIGLFERTIEQIISVPFAYHMDDPLRIWDTLCLGTGFDGQMDPVNRYPTVLQFKIFEDDLVEILTRLKRSEPVWFGSYRPQDLARKICFENAIEFVKKNYE
jgi:hypothetical protein